MPFTLSHAAAVIPLSKKCQKFLPLSALVIGSFSPDFRYFIPGFRIRIFSHSPEGLIMFCLPLSLLALVIFHYLAKEPLFQLLPEGLQKRLDPGILRFSFQPWPKMAAIVLAILIGGLTHIFWDSFTHEAGWAVERWPVLVAMFYRFPGYEIRVYKLLQHLSTLSGLMAVGYWYWAWYKNAYVQVLSGKPFFRYPVKKRIIFILCSSALIFGIGFGLLGATGLKGFRAVQEFAIQTVVGSMIGLTLMVLFYSLVFRSLTRRWYQSPVEDESGD